MSALLAALLLGGAVLRSEAAPGASARQGGDAAPAQPLRDKDDRGRVVDWTAGQLLARGLGLADRRAPSPAAAREAAKRRAISDAAAQLAEAAAKVPLAGGETVGKRVPAAVLAELAAEASVASSEPLVDGSWRVELALPLEALRQAAQGERTAPADGDAAAVPAVLVVHAPADAVPAIGVAVSDGKRSVRGATLWVRGSAAGLLPAAQLATAPVAKAANAAGKAGGGKAGGELRVDRLAGTTDATLLVVVLGQ